MSGASVTGRICSWVEGNLDKDFTLEEMSEELNYSKFYMERVFKENTGTTIYRYVQGRRLEEAARKEEAIEAAKEAEGARRKHILVIDDDSSILKLLKGYLAERYDVATAISGKVAMKFLETKETDLVLLDYEMPVENGSVVFGKIRSMEKTKDLPVVFLTGVTEKSKITEVLSMKPQGYLLKPVDMEKLSSTIKGILG